jgi:hypothetical protein
MATLLSNIQDVCLELGLPVPNAVATSNDEATLQLLALMNRVGSLLTTETNWQFLAKEYRFQTQYYQYTGNSTLNSQTLTSMSSITGLTSDFMVIGDGVMQDTFVTNAVGNTVSISIPAIGTTTGSAYTFGQVNYAMPSDYERIVNKTQYNKSNRWSIIGPKDAQEWQWLKASYVTTGPRMRFRIIGNKFSIWPAPSAKLVLGFEYQSNAWAVDSSGNTKQKLSADDDTSLFPDKLLVLGTKLKYFEIKGFDTTALQNDFNRELSKFMAQNSGADTVSLAPKYPDILLTQNNIPDTGYGNVSS